MAYLPFRNHDLTETHIGPHHKWQQIQTILYRHANATQVNPSLSFKKLVLSRLLSENALVFLLQYIGLTLSTLLPWPSPLWMASGTVCAFIFLRGYSVLGGIWLGSLAAYYFASGHLMLSLSCAALQTLQAGGLFFIYQRYLGPAFLFSHTRYFIYFIILSGTMTAFISLSLFNLCYAALPSVVSPLRLWCTWWLANWNGLFIFFMALITLDAYFPLISDLKKQNKVKLSLAYGCLALLAFLLLLNTDFAVHIGLCVLIFTCVFLIAKVYKWCGLFAAEFLLGFILSLGAYVKAPFFMQNTFTPLLCLQFTLLLTLIVNTVLHYSASKYSTIN